MYFLRKIFSPCFLILSILVLFYTFYRSEYVWQGTNRDNFLIYYIISIILICLSLVSYNKKIKDYLIISFLIFGICFYGFEIYLIQTDSDKDRYEEYKKNLDIYKSVSVKFSPYKSLKYNPEFLPLSGISNSRTVSCNENGYYMIYDSDRYGFNNPDYEWDKSEVEYLLIGDSFTHGFCVNRPDDISSVLRNLSNKSVINLGYGANGPLLTYASLREFYKKKTNKIIWLYYEGNDLDGLQIELKNKLLLKYYKDQSFSQDLKNNQNLTNSILRKKIEYSAKKYSLKNQIVRLITLVSTRTFIKGNLKNNIINKQERNYDNFKKILQLKKIFAEKNQSQLYFVYLPTFKRYKETYNNTDYKMVKSIVKKLEVPFIDIHRQIFLKQKDPLSLFPSRSKGHYTAKGYKKVAQTIYLLTN